MNLQLKQLSEYLVAHPCESSGHVYHPLPFPEFDGLRTSTKAASAHRKLKLLLSFLPSRWDPATVLDIGANAGFYAFSLSQRGATVHAYEPHVEYVDVGRQIVAATNLSVRWINKPLGLEDLHGKRYDIALMMSVFQWMSEGNTRLAPATELLRAVAAACDVLFFELGCNAGKSAITTSERPIAWIWRLLQATASPKRVAYLGSTAAWSSATRYLFVASDHTSRLGSSSRLTPWQRLVTRALSAGWLR